MTAAPALQFGFSPCPNDTFAFHAAVEGLVPSSVRLVPVMADIEVLNDRAVQGRDPLPVTKLSIPAFASAADRYVALSAGAALGHGCGPLVVFRDRAPFRELGDLANARFAIPGLQTTAWFLLRTLMGRAPEQRVAMRFDRVMPAVAAGEFDAGLVIHESRFTYRQHGLRAIDLGELWERATGGPLPLAVIAARRDLDPATIEAVTATLRASVAFAQREPQRSRQFVRAHAQELSDEVCAQHIALYVNEFSEDLGTIGRRAIEEMLRRGRAAGSLPDVASPFPEHS